MARKYYVTNGAAFDEDLHLISEENPTAALFWYWILGHLDDWGRGIDSAFEIKAKIAPMISGLSVSTVEKALCLYADRGMIQRYAHEGRTYFAVKARSWVEIQSHIRWDKKHKDGVKASLPAPPDPAYDVSIYVEEHELHLPKKSRGKPGKKKQIPDKSGKSRKNTGLKKNNPAGPGPSLSPSPPSRPKTEREGGRDSPAQRESGRAPAEDSRSSPPAAACHFCNGEPCWWHSRRPGERTPLAFYKLFRGNALPPKFYEADPHDVLPAWKLVGGDEETMINELETWRQGPDLSRLPWRPQTGGDYDVT